MKRTTHIFIPKSKPLKPILIGIIIGIFIGIIIGMLISPKFIKELHEKITTTTEILLKDILSTNLYHL